MRLILSLIALMALTSAPAMATEEPPHRVIERVGDIEIREYAPMIVAEVEVSGDQTSASNRGFRPLAGYIFGDNAPREEIAMTAPVTARASEGQKIDMTAPVTAAEAGEGRWTVAFVMPDSWSMDTLPAPNDPNVTLREVDARRVVAIQFNGGRNARWFAQKEAELLAFVAERGFDTVGEPTFAYYSPPWIPTAFRRNEIWVEIAAS